MEFIPYGKQFIDDDDKKAVSDALDRPFITTGPTVKKFEEAIC